MDKGALEQVGWKIVSILNYDTAYAIPRLFKELSLVQKLPEHSDNDLTKVRNYFSSKTAKFDLKAFKNSFGFNPPKNSDWILDYNSGIPNSKYIKIMAEEIFLIFTQEIKIEAVSFNLIAQTLDQLFSKLSIPEEPISFYSFEDFVITLCGVLDDSSIAGYKTRSHLNRYNPLPIKNSRKLTQQDFSVLFSNEKSQDLLAELYHKLKAA